MCKTGIDHGNIVLDCINSVLSVTFFSHPYTNIQITSKYWFLSGVYLHNWLIHSSTYMKKVNDITCWLSQSTHILKYFVWSPGL